MTGLAFRFFATAIVLLTAGMLWGIQMGITQDHTLSPAHAHLNLAGGVLMALFGIFYHLVPAAAASVLGKVHYLVALVGAILFAIGIAIHHSGGTELFAILGSLVTLGSMLIFLATMLRTRT
ncbi:hypothetical protein EI983_10620 [Roseovarius faecimaris]|uniref:Uncharacterized protein n=1 Tax=Roseovarius faecimaris TaxID=2494550 RepID=A0A6I6IY15_9RHOB|nr:hypothetical protein [Roseovarius faecimaris]QGY00378.1 hypothetical protein EI983_10620 [Roseovarius faecimaris]